MLSCTWRSRGFIAGFPKPRSICSTSMSRPPRSCSISRGEPEHGSLFSVRPAPSIIRSSSRLCREDDLLEPQTYFAFSKLAAERFALAYSPAYFDVFVPRFFSPYGPGQDDRLISGLTTMSLPGDQSGCRRKGMVFLPRRCISTTPCACCWQRSRRAGGVSSISADRRR